MWLRNIQKLAHHDGVKIAHINLNKVNVIQYIPQRRLKLLFDNGKEMKFYPIQGQEKQFEEMYKKITSSMYWGESTVIDI